MNASIVTPLNTILVGTILLDPSTIKNFVLRTEQTNTSGPIPRFVGPVGVRLIAGIFGQTGGQIEEDTIRNSILVVVPGIEGEDLPAKTAVTRCSIPASSLRVEDTLYEGKPLWLITRRVGVILLSGAHG